MRVVDEVPGLADARRVASSPWKRPPDDPDEFTCPECGEEWPGCTSCLNDDCPSNQEDTMLTLTDTAYVDQARPMLVAVRPHRLAAAERVLWAIDALADPPQHVIDLDDGTDCGDWLFRVDEALSSRLMPGEPVDADLATALLSEAQDRVVTAMETMLRSTLLAVADIVNRCTDSDGTNGGDLVEGILGLLDNYGVPFNKPEDCHAD